MLATYEGGCHCGQVRFRVQGDLDDVSVCNCSICTMKGIVHMVVPREQFELLRGEDAISTYSSAPASRSTRSAGIAASTRSIRRGRSRTGSA